MGEETSTLEQIQQAAVQEFLDKGFRGASLRQIVKNAGVTTGAFYGYFSSKEALFASIVEPHAAAIMGRFMQTQTEFAALPAAEQPSHMGVESSACVDWMVDYMYRHSVPVKLLLCRAEGTPYEHFVHNMVEVEVEATEQYIQVLRQLGRMCRSWTISCAISSPAVCSTPCSKSWSTTCRMTTPSSISGSCGNSTWLDGKN